MRDSDTSPSHIKIIIFSLSDSLLINSVIASSNPSSAFVPPIAFNWVILFFISPLLDVSGTLTVAYVLNSISATLSLSINASTNAFNAVLASLILCPPILPDVSTTSATS